MKTLLVLATDYPNPEDGVNLQYIHTRNIYYQKNGFKITVLNFAAKENYEIDGVKVITLNWFKSQPSQETYDLLVSHAPNLRNHYKFLKKYGKIFNKIVFFFHGHEVLKTQKVYSKPYPYIQKNPIIPHLINLYDDFKLRIWRKYIAINYKKLYFVFVSQWMKDEFIKWVKPSEKHIDGRNYITYNCIGETFEEESYNADIPKDYDFVTIRANLDGSKYSVDIVNELAKRHPEYKFLLIGKGEFFNHYEKAQNLDWQPRRLRHNEMIEVLNSAKCALMPTRTDAQGVMMCEMAAFGLPLITSDIPVCHEVFKDDPNVGFIDNNFENDILTDEFNRVKDIRFKSERYFMKNTGDRELEIFDKIGK